MNTTDALTLPKWLILVSFIAGMILATAVLNYPNDGRINIFWILLLWVILPLLGSILSIVQLVRGVRNSWLTQILKPSPYWQPKPIQAWWIISRLQGLWLVFGIGTLSMFAIQLFISDLAFGWSTTLLSSSDALLNLMQFISTPWVVLWPQAVPDLYLLETTQFNRIDANTTSFQDASRWWPFIMASLITYNLLPRSLLAIATYVKWHRLHSLELRIAPAQPQAPASSTSASGNPPLDQAYHADDWQEASHVYWQMSVPNSEALYSLGLQDWSEDQRVWNALLANSPHSILWKVKSSCTPMAELSDWIAEANSKGIKQALQVHHTHQDTDRHKLSWKAFAQKHALIWMEPSE
ncbi:hypothetical protein DN062_06250 [Nitrincola tibetensis]|uniref:DUF2868 domain-containing protein n=1 Tax=Nitrincola tibetensis TaxID=2219697 RepID=A0A364NPP2_9GAMM|nr:DUF2868 domain-containing protein [Nitrincola tibetensis]RAU19069.1 hypothetical protein DN062_06250 [Nitrincola tibetensis]